MVAKSRIKRTRREWGVFMAQMSLVVALFAFGLYFGIYLRDRNLMRHQMLTSARAHFQSIVLTRMWNAMYGGVYVEKKPGVQTNPYLRDPEVQLRDGRIFTLRNPAMMTREISELAEREGLYKYHITSLKPLNPLNAHDAFEREALERFDRGEKEVTSEDIPGDPDTFRYMAPLMTTPDCMRCHAEQGYKVGDVRGGISVSFDISAVQEGLRINQYVIFGLILASTGIVLGIFFFFSLRLMTQLQTAQEALSALAVTDELTGVANRRQIFDRLDEELDRARRYGTNLSLIMIDLDLFKNINDTYGHPAGDLVLQEVARLLSANIRVSDIIGRYGGEEFVILIPTLGVDEAVKVAEKLRVVIEVNDIMLEGPPLNVTMSAGIADVESVKHEEGSLRDALIHAADNAMYKAKAEGRNRVVAYKPALEIQLPLV